MTYEKEQKPIYLTRVGRKQEGSDIKLKQTNLLLKKWLYFKNFTYDRLNGAEGKKQLLKSLKILKYRSRISYLILESYYIANSRIGGCLYETQLPLLSKVATLNNMTELAFTEKLVKATKQLKKIMENEGN
ncbi:hypothetical protein SAMN05878443_0785 [Carnobacterium alterfunditum]|uniref:Uncharacterized protein n=1 Tax=Carnobacterium alterfunditum TaxID=28230 RepID=A0A1N6FRS9_9LACT|nr:hypothetical protein [Carnobacterium alterfunditum]SIN97948.1 hypothetical protein SAMN05878443_0785 [Carnobacterium alterfunditum]